MTRGGWIWAPLALGVLALVWLAPARELPARPDPNAQGLLQRLGERVPDADAFVDEAGACVTLARYLRDRPVVLTLGYSACPRLCGLIADGLARSLRDIEGLTAGQDFEVVRVSIDPAETPAAARAQKAALLAHPDLSGVARGWHFLTGRDASIRRLADAIGFRYARDPASGQFVHPAGVLVLTPQGVVSRVLYGVDFPARDLRLALVEASGGRIGRVTDALLLLCVGYDCTTGAYTPLVTRIVRVVSAGFLLLVIAGLSVLHRMERRAR